MEGPASSGTDLLCETIGFTAERLMAQEVEGVAGAGHGERRWTGSTSPGDGLAAAAGGDEEDREGRALGEVLHQRDAVGSGQNQVRPPGTVDGRTSPRFACHQLGASGREAGIASTSQ